MFVALYTNFELVVKIEKKCCFICCDKVMVYKTLLV